MSDRCARITLAMALVPLVFGMMGVVAPVVSERGTNVLGTVLAMALAVVIWRKYVRWTVLRSMSTFGLMTLALVQVIAWQPLWSTGCSATDVALCTAQSLVVLGSALIAVVFLWWGTVLTHRIRRQTLKSPPGRFSMTPNAARLTIGIALLPFLPGFYYLFLEAFPHFTEVSWPADVMASATYELCILFAVAIWLLLWRRAVTWNRKCRVVTLFLTTVLLISPVLLIWRPDLTLGIFDDVWRAFCDLAPLFAWALWLAGTAWAWRTARPRLLHDFTDAANAESLALCPTCGYSLRGLREVRCPECGWASTVDDIVERSLDRALAVP